MNACINGHKGVIKLLNSSRMLYKSVQGMYCSYKGEI